MGTVSVGYFYFILFYFFLLKECAVPFLPSLPSGAMMRLEVWPFCVTLQDFEDFDGWPVLWALWAIFLLDFTSPVRRRNYRWHHPLFLLTPWCLLLISRGHSPIQSPVSEKCPASLWSLLIWWEYLFHFFFVTKGSHSLSLGLPWTHSYPPAVASQVLGLQIKLVCQAKDVDDASARNFFES